MKKIFFCFCMISFSVGLALAQQRPGGGGGNRGDGQTSTAPTLTTPTGAPTRVNLKTDSTVTVKNEITMCFIRIMKEMM